MLSPRWEVFQGVLEGTLQEGKQRLTKGGFTLHLKNTGKVVAAEEDLFVDETEIKLKVIQGYNRGMEYLIMDGKCIKKPLKPRKPISITDRIH